MWKEKFPMYIYDSIISLEEKHKTVWLELEQKLK